MKLTSCFKLLGIGAIAISATLLLESPGYTKPKVRVTTTPSTPGATVVPVVPSGSGTAVPGAPAPGGVICVPGSPTPCAQPLPSFPGGVTGVPGGVICVPGSPTPCGQPIAKDYFFCGKDPHGRPTTYVNTPSGNLPLVRWVSHYFEPSGYTPDVRCRDVSQRFNQFYRQGILNFITTGFINNQPVVCVASRMGGPCTATLFTLKSGQSATRTIQQLFDVRAGASGPLLESEERIYVDMRPYIDAIQANR